MDTSFKTILWHQFGAAIDMLENAMLACPDEKWNTDAEYWYRTYHTLFYLDYYLSDPESFSPPSPFTLSEFDPNGAMPERVYTKEELLTYLEYSRQKGYDLIRSLTNETAAKRFINEYKNYSILEILIYNMRHVQHHTAQLNLLLRQSSIDPPRWVSQAKLKL